VGSNPTPSATDLMARFQMQKGTIQSWMLAAVRGDHG
jgi:hypothetical protein